MNIAIFTDMYLEAAGGIPSVVRASKRELERAGHIVVVFCPGYDIGDEKGVVMVPTGRIRIAGAPMAKSVREIEDFVRRGDWYLQLAEQDAARAWPEGFGEFDVVHVHYELMTSIAGARLAREYGTRLVQTMHGREDRAAEVNLPWGLRGVLARLINRWHWMGLSHEVKARMILQKKLPFARSMVRAKMWELMVAQANFADVVITPSEHFARKLRAVGVWRPVVAIPSGVSAEVLAEKPRQRNWDGKVPLKMVWNSRVSREKRLSVVIQALKEVEAALATGNTDEKTMIMLEVYGDGNELGRAKRLVKRLGPQMQVQFFGQRPRAEILTVMKEAQLAVVASVDFDTQGMTLVEAQAMGLPVLFCDPDMEEVVPKGGGILTKTPDAAGFAAALMEVLQAPERIGKMSAVMIRARSRAAMARGMERLLEVYRGDE